MTREELKIYDTHPQRLNVRSHNIRIGCYYKQTEKVPYIDSTVHRNQGNFGYVGNVVIATNTYVDQECGVLFIAFKCKDSWAGISMPIGMFGYYFRPCRTNNKNVEPQ